MGGVGVWVPKGSDPDAVLQIIRAAAGALLVRAELFDTFEKGDPSTGSGQVKLSLAFRLVFQSLEKTLTDIEANAAMENVYSEAKNQGWEVR